MQDLPAVYVALVHYPVYHKDGKVMATSITSLDLHDIARTCVTYGVARYYVINPLKSQQYFARRISRYWLEGPGGPFNPSRKDAFEVVAIRDNLEETIEEIVAIEGARPFLIATDARSLEEPTPPEEAVRQAADAGRPILVLLGTGYGMTREVIRECDCFLPPIRPGVWNHLSVRAAAAIILDRLVGEKRNALLSLGAEEAARES